MNKDKHETPAETTAQPTGETPETEAQERGSDTAALTMLGSAFLERLGVPEGMTAKEAVDAILSMWRKADEGAAARRGQGGEEADEAEAPARRLPRTIRGGLAEAPEADYESMSAEQFRRLQKQLKRASMDGRRIRL